MPVLRKWEEIEEFEGGPTDSENLLIARATAGEECILGNGKLPSAFDEERNIRAHILRYLILGGCETKKVGPIGVALKGARVVGRLDLDFADIKGALRLRNCHFPLPLETELTRFNLISLSGSRLTQWRAPGIKVEGSVFLREVVTRGKIDLAEATIGGQLACEGADLRSFSGAAINAQGARIAGGVFLHPTRDAERNAYKTPFRARGEVSFVSATLGTVNAEGVTLSGGSGSEDYALNMRNVTINGTLRLNKTVFDHELLLSGAVIQGNLEMENAKLGNDVIKQGHAFTAHGMRVEQTVQWKKITHTKGKITFAGAHATQLDDDPDIKLNPETLNLDGFTYTRIKGNVAVTDARKAWLRSGSYHEAEFRPQPYTQYAKFLRDVGHDSEARDILYLREAYRLKEQRATWRLQWRAARDARRHSHWLPGKARSVLRWFAWKGLQIWHWLFRVVVGYGHRPHQSIYMIMLLVLLTSAPASVAWHTGAMAPNSAPVLVSDEWQILAADPDVSNPALCWSNSVPGRDWETFSSFAFGLDVVIPIIDFGQTDAWAPSTSRHWSGTFLYGWRWVMTMAGWIVTALGAAAITSLIRRD